MDTTNVAPVGIVIPTGFKICAKCKRNKSLTRFYARPNRRSGYGSYCKDCLVLMSSDYNRNRRARTTSVQASEPYEYIKEKDAKRLERHPEKVRAKQVASVLMVTKGNQRHHWSYNEIHYKDIIELSRRQHGFIHRYIRYDKPTKMYRRMDTGELLDTKSKHEEYIKALLKVHIDI